MGLELREKFLEATSEKEWADVKPLDWHDEEIRKTSLLSMEEHCQYKFVAHTEGNSYSGRLKYLQNCRSVVVAHESEWIQHQTPLMVSSGPKQNFVQVSRGFTDLEQAIQELRKDDSKARKIADNNVETFRERYLTPAAETCYWRRLIHGWARATDFEPQFYKEVNGTLQWRGVPLESFALENRLEWDPY